MWRASMTYSGDDNLNVSAPEIKITFRVRPRLTIIRFHHSAWRCDSTASGAGEAIAWGAMTLIYRELEVSKVRKRPLWLRLLPPLVISFNYWSVGGPPSCAGLKMIYNFSVFSIKPAINFVRSFLHSIGNPWPFPSTIHRVTPFSSPPSSFTNSSPCGCVIIRSTVP